MDLPSPSDDPFHLQRFISAQASSYEAARAELANGLKRSHRMWFIFPQIQGLGSSAMSERFAIADLQEASAYLRHPLLGPRLRECTGLVNAVANRSVSDIFPYPDDLKFHSSITLFERAVHLQTAPPAMSENVFAEALSKYFGGQPDQGTLARL